MKREIKFRVWSENTRKMIPISLWHNFNLFINYVKETIMQYTGLKDKNGKEIYEGDILLSTSDIVKWATDEKTGKVAKDKSEVVWSDKIPAFCKKEEGRISGFAMYPDIIKKYSEVIGNIYENPELLKEATNE